MRGTGYRTGRRSTKIRDRSQSNSHLPAIPYDFLMPTPPAAAPEPLFQALEHVFSDWVVRPLDAVIFFDVALWDDATGNAIVIPAVVCGT